MPYSFQRRSRDEVQGAGAVAGQQLERPAHGPGTLLAWPPPQRLASGSQWSYVFGLVARWRDLRELRDRLLPVSPAPRAGTPSVGCPQSDCLPHQRVLWRRRRWGEVTGERFRRRPARPLRGMRRWGDQPTPRSPARLVACERGSRAGSWSACLPSLCGTSTPALGPRARLTCRRRRFGYPISRARGGRSRSARAGSAVSTSGWGAVEGRGQAAAVSQ